MATILLANPSPSPPPPRQFFADYGFDDFVMPTTEQTNFHRTSRRKVLFPCNELFVPDSDGPPSLSSHSFSYLEPTAEWDFTDPQIQTCTANTNK